MDARRSVAVGAGTALIGTLASGPLGVWLVRATHPQPAWRDAETFVRSYHDVQVLPYFAGLFLVGGFVGLIAGLHGLAPERLRFRTTCALAFVAAFAAMIFTNYAIQTTFVPALVKYGSARDEPLISALTMWNPRSLGWALEMWGYALLGVATWFTAPVFSTSGLERLTGVLFTLNGFVSIATALATAFHPGWVMTGTGLASFVTWNILIVAMTALALVAMRARRPDSPQAFR
ncbi:MAG TPA: hypothetical protein VIE88_06430 [Vicinamibacteria bacterium]|jgi:hypothetical protein